MNSMKLFKPKGFTLIELLVVVAILGLLASVVFISFGNFQQNARDTKREADLRQLKTALELCKEDVDCPSAGAGSVYPSDPVDNSGANATGWMPVPIGVYLGTLPQDPSNSVPYVYTWLANGPAGGVGTEFCIFADLEGGSQVFASTLGIGTPAAALSAASVPADCTQ